MCFLSGFSSILSGCHYFPNMLGRLCPDCFRSFIISFNMCLKLLTYKTFFFFSLEIFKVVNKTKIIEEHF